MSQSMYYESQKILYINKLTQLLQNSETFHYFIYLLHPSQPTHKLHVSKTGRAKGIFCKENLNTMWCLSKHCHS